MASHSGSVFIVDDDDEIRSVLELQVASIGLDARSFDRPRRLLAEYEPSGPGCVVVDVMMPEMTGLQLLRAARAAGIELPFIVLTAHADVPIAVEAFRAGAFDFLEKPFSKSIFLEMVQRAVEHSRSLLDAEAKEHELEEALALLTGREREVAAEMINGDSNKEIARKLNLSHRTVERHRQNVLRKLGVRSVLELGSRLSSVSAFPGAPER